MPIIKCGDIYTYQFGAHSEPRFEVALGGLPVGYSIVKPFPHLKPEDKYRLSLDLTEKEYEEIAEAMLDKLLELNESGSFIPLKDAKKVLTDLLGRAVGKSKTKEGYRFYGSRNMTYMNRTSEQLEAISLPMYDAEGAEIPGGIMLGTGSIVRTKFTVSLFKRDKNAFLKIEPTRIFIVKLVEPERRAKLTHEGLNDTDAYDF